MCFYSCAGQAPPTRGRSEKKAKEKKKKELCKGVHFFSSRDSTQKYYVDLGESIQAAIAAKDAQAEAAAQVDDAKAAQAPPKLNPKATKCPELRGNISVIDEVRKICA